ncbi:MAG: nickel pincer cofactor biosynthesis protein LarB [Candidatus Omnitrophica bacterium]|nr:nickel pincer cofactor biosynthesis protein LarB [Candidatus Omnitrophota bacterium]
MTNLKGFCDLGFAKIDTDRFARRGFSEAIYCRGKDKEHLKDICGRFIQHQQDLLLTKLEKDTFFYLKKSIPRLRYYPLAKIGFLKKGKKNLAKGLVAVISAGTSDISVAEEASVTLELMGNKVVRIYDVGVAGVHRLMHHLDLIKKAKVVIVVAGMEGALASLVSGLVKSPIVAVPTSCGYGASFQGLAALLTMLNSCSPGITVVNIDNGFGAGYFASLINK